MSPMSGSPGTKLQVSIGICAYNEEANIGRLLKSIEAQGSQLTEISQIIVVSSDCHDRTEDIVKSFGTSNPKIRLIEQRERKGKASAVNLFLKAAMSDICVLVSADTLLLKDTIEQLCLPFFEKEVGMTGGHPIPVNDPKTFMGFVSHLIWRLAYEVSMIEPKLGEIIAFRHNITEIPENTAVDEASIEVAVRHQGYNLRYVPRAIIYNKGPEKLSDLIKQRRRIYAGHLHLKKTTGYVPSSMSWVRLLRLVFRTLDMNWRSLIFTPAAVVLEAYSRFLGTYDFYISRKNPYIWDIASSTKTLPYSPEDQKSGNGV